MDNIFKHYKKRCNNEHCSSDYMSHPLKRICSWFVKNVLKGNKCCSDCPHYKL